MAQIGEERIRAKNIIKTFINNHFCIKYAAIIAMRYFYTNRETYQPETQKLYLLLIYIVRCIPIS
ncbi:MAG: hypothetical protein JWP81_1734 [Ferruginibacter sp.]|nr:hypothetical protein [Ferruginibacter sp.]